MRGTELLAAAILAVSAESPPRAEPPPVRPGPAQEFVVGELAVEEFLKARPLSSDGNLVLRVDRIGRIVARASDRPDLPYNFLVIEGSELQGYSFMSGTVCLTRSLVELLASDDELAFAVGHELAHVALRHIVTRVGFEEALGAGGAAAPKAGLSFRDQDAELEADRYGALYALRAGYRYSASRQVLERLAAADSARGDDAAHPSYADRIDRFRLYGREIEKCLEAFDKGKEALRAGRPDEAISAFTIFTAAFPNSVTGRVNLGASYLARVRAKAGTPRNLEEWVPFLPEPGVLMRGPYELIDLRKAEDNFVEALRLHSDAIEARIGLALTRTREARLDEARGLLLPILSEAPDRPEVSLCLGNVEYLAGNPAAAATRYRQALEGRPGWPQATKNLAVALEASGETKGARELWATLVEDPAVGAEARRWLEIHRPGD